MLSETGAPTPVAWARLRAPVSLMAPLDDSVITGVVAASALRTRYAEALDRESAYEKLTRRLREAPDREASPENREASPGSREPRVTRDARREDASVMQKVVASSAFRSALRSAGTVIGREITRSLFGTARRRR